MNVLTIPNWSIGRERTIVRQMRDLLDEADVNVHYCNADIDHNRTVTAFSGTLYAVEKTLFELAELTLPSIDLCRHSGVHPRIGALDVCPFVPLPVPVGEQAIEFGEWVDQIAFQIAEKFSIPVFLYEHSAKRSHHSNLPSLRKGGFGGLIGKEIFPDYGPSTVHPHLGATVIGWRDFLVALNMNFNSRDKGAVERIAFKMRNLRREKDPRFEGVRTLGLDLSAREIVQVSMNITKPDITPIDPILEFIEEMANHFDLPTGYPELIGVIRDVDIERSVKLGFRPEQVVCTRDFLPFNATD